MGGGREQYTQNNKIERRQHRERWGAIEDSIVIMKREEE